jgi:hypothetical protein
MLEQWCEARRFFALFAEARTRGRKRSALCEEHVDRTEGSNQPEREHTAEGTYDVIAASVCPGVSGKRVAATAPVLFLQTSVI